MKAIIARSTGMIGNLVLSNCIQPSQIHQVISLVPKPGHSKIHNKITEIIVTNFEDYSAQSDVFKDVDIIFSVCEYTLIKYLISSLNT